MADEKDKKQYEMSFLLKEEGTLPVVLKFVKDLGGEIEFEGPTQKIVLTYPIQKETSAYFGYVHFSMDPAEIAHLVHEMETKPGILRHLIITPPFKKSEARPRPEMPAARTPRIMAPRMEAAKSVETLTNEDLEKKIEEILK
jgi:ribosomal protein S6